MALRLACQRTHSGIARSRGPSTAPQSANPLPLRTSPIARFRDEDGPGLLLKGGRNGPVYAPLKTDNTRCGTGDQLSVHLAVDKYEGQLFLMFFIATVLLGPVFTPGFIEMARSMYDGVGSKLL